jgi:ubiquinone/menaquinone biosynthesis C-methylase UbiE
MDEETLPDRAGSAPAAQSHATDIYALGRDREESARLRQQSGQMRPYSARLLDRTGLASGQRAIDLGCGPSGIIDLLAERVAPGGQVTGLDADPVHVTMARQFAAEHGLGNVEVIEADARHTGLPPDSFDLVHARTLLVTIPDPAEVLAEMTRVARPGGWVACLEADGEHSLCYPAHPAWDRLSQIFLTAFSRNGADPLTGRRLPELYRRAGLADVGAECVAPLHPAGYSRRAIRLDLVRGMRPVILQHGIADEAELDELDRALREHLADPDTLVMPFLYFMVWGRKPGRQPET